MIAGDGEEREMCPTWPSEALQLCALLYRVNTTFCTAGSRGVYWREESGQSFSWSEPVGDAGGWK